MRVGIESFVVPALLLSSAAMQSFAAPGTIIHVPGDQPTIQAGIDAAVDGDTVVVADGVYTGPGNRDIELRGKAITVRSANEAAGCIIDCGGSEDEPHRGFYIHEGESRDTVITGFTIRNGYVNEAAPGGDRGGGILIELSSPTVVDCVLVKNTAVIGGGLGCSRHGEPIVVGCSFERNHAAGGGGGLGNVVAWIIAKGCTFSGNHAEGSGGAAYSFAGELTIEQCRFYDNEAVDRGGALRLRGDSVVRHSTFEGNRAEFGGAIAGDTVFISDSTFSSNEAEGWGGALMMSSTGSPVVTRCQFVDNTAEVGGGIYVYGYGVSVRNCIVRGNTARYGGGIINSSATLVSCAVFDNTAELGGGVGSQGSSITINCTIADNTADEGGGVYLFDNVEFPLVQNSIVWGNTPDSFAGHLVRSVTFSDIEGGYEGEGNIDVDPQFVDPAMGDYRLSRSSPCIEAGDWYFREERVTRDLDGHARWLCERVDMGAYEFGIGDHDCDRVVDLDDYGGWADCVTGPGGGPYPTGCESFDFEFDGDVDIADFAGFTAAFDTP